MKELEKSDYFHLEKMERIHQMSQSAEKMIENHKYYRSLSKDEIDQKNNDLHQAMEQITILEEEIKDINARKKDLKKIIADNHNDIFSGQISKTGTVYEIVNENNELEVINEEGYIIDKKRYTGMRNMFNNNKKAM